MGESECLLVEVEAVERGGDDDNRQHTQCSEKSTKESLLRCVVRLGDARSRSDDGESEDGGDDQLPEALPRVLGICQPRGLQHVVMSTEEDCHLHDDEDEEEQIEESERDRPLAEAELGRGEREISKAPPGRKPETERPQEPLSEAASTLIEPPCSSTIQWAMARPRPLPPSSDERARSLQ